MEDTYNYDYDYDNKKGLLPGENNQEELNNAIEREEYHASGGTTSCGHDFWDKDVEYGDVVFCTRCSQFFTKIKVLPWITIGKYQIGTNHLTCDSYVAVKPRITT